MSGATDTKNNARLYGNWSRPRSAGLYGLGSVGTRLLFAGLILLIITVMFFGLLAGLAVGLVIVVCMALVLRKDKHGRSLLDSLSSWRASRKSRKTGSWLYRSGPLGKTPWGTNQLPGVAAQLRMSEHQDAYGRTFALVHSPSQKTFTAVIACEPDGASLVDPEQVDIWVADWGHWLARLGDEPGLKLATATIETAPDTGHRLRHEVEMAMADDAPEFAKSVLTEVVDRYPAGSNTITAWVTLTFSAASPGTGKLRTPEEMGRDLGSRLPGMTADLGATGAGATRPVAGEEVCEMIRLAYNPSAALAMDEARAEAAADGDDEPLLRLSDVGPSASEARWDTYRHDEATSVSWTMSVAPRGNVPSNILAALLAPQADIARKRVTMIYRPVDAARAAAIVESDLRAAEFVETSAAKASARSVAATRRAQATASEEAAGAGLINFGMIVTATVLDDAMLPIARATVDTLGARARLLLRPSFGAMDAAFVAGLPLGVALGDYLSISSEFKEKLG